MEAYSSTNLSFSCRDFYSNDITIGYGDDAFQAWMTTSKSPEVPEQVRDVGGGEYVVELRTYNETGTAFFFVQRDGLNIPGSPFEVRARRRVGRWEEGGAARATLGPNMIAAAFLWFLR